MQGRRVPRPAHRMNRVAIVGFGSMGRARLDALEQLVRAGCDIDVVGVADPSLESTAVSSDVFGPIGVHGDAGELMSSVQADWLIVATPHSRAVPITTAALLTGASVLLEKPLGTNALQAAQLVDAQVRPAQLWVGLNYRFFDGVRALIEDAQAGTFGRVMSVNGVLGHGSVPGAEADWKLDPTESGWGALLDAGIHLLDLAQLLAPDVCPRACISARPFWPTGVIDDVHVLMTSGEGAVVNLQASLTRWRSTFRLEVWGTDGYGIVDGRGRSYGPQTYVRGRRWAWCDGRPQRDSEEHVLVTDGSSVFAAELGALLEPGDGSQRAASADEALRTMELIDQCRALEAASG